jgi:hypothetical protein
MCIHVLKDLLLFMRGEIEVDVGHNRLELGLKTGHLQGHKHDLLSMLCAIPNPCSSHRNVAPADNSMSRTTCFPRWDFGMHRHLLRPRSSSSKHAVKVQDGTLEQTLHCRVS